MPYRFSPVGAHKGEWRTPARGDVHATDGDICSAAVYDLGREHLLRSVSNRRFFPFRRTLTLSHTPFGLKSDYPQSIRQVWTLLYTNQQRLELFLVRFSDYCYYIFYFRIVFQCSNRLKVLGTLLVLRLGQSRSIQLTFNQY